MSNKSMRWFPGPRYPRLAHVDSKYLAAANGGVGTYKSSRRCPCANSCPTSLLLTFGTSFVPLLTSIQRTPINFLSGSASTISRII